MNPQVASAISREHTADIARMAERSRMLREAGVQRRRIGLPTVIAAVATAVTLVGVALQLV